MFPAKTLHITPMDYTNWHQPSLPSNSNTATVHSYFSNDLYYLPQPQSHLQSINPNPSLPNPETQYYATDASDFALRPPGVDSYASLASHPHGQSGYHAYTTAHAPYDSNQGLDMTAYSDLNAHNWDLSQAVRLYGLDPAFYTGALQDITVPPNGVEQWTAANSSSTFWAKHALQPCRSITSKKRIKVKIVQSAYCEVCKIDCNSKDVLDQHKLGKKHKKNLEKLQEATAAANNAFTGLETPLIGPQEKPDNIKTLDSQVSKKKTTKNTENWETKRKKIVEGGAAAEAVRVCPLCNVVCNSEIAFSYHLAGQKHAAMVKKHGAGTGMVILPKLGI